MRTVSLSIGAMYVDVVVRDSAIMDVTYSTTFRRDQWDAMRIRTQQRAVDATVRCDFSSARWPPGPHVYIDTIAGVLLWPRDKGYPAGLNPPGVVLLHEKSGTTYDPVARRATRR